MLHLAERPPDEDHAYGHAKAEYFSSGVEGGLIVLAATGIAWAAISRLFRPEPVSETALGLAINAIASAINGGMGLWLLRVGQIHGSMALEADGRHLLVDVMTSLGVIAGLVAVAMTGWQWLDPVIGLIIAGNIIWQGVSLVRRSALGLLDTALPAEERERLEQVLNAHCRRESLLYHALRTRQGGARRFMSVHILFPGDWTLKRAHDAVERIEHDLRAAVNNLTVFTHLEPLEDPTSWRDTQLQRDDARLPLSGEGAAAKHKRGNKP
jgi:cation diffusion facilitator family transporter